VGALAEGARVAREGASVVGPPSQGVGDAVGLMVRLGVGLTVPGCAHDGGCEVAATWIPRPACVVSSSLRSTSNSRGQSLPVSHSVWSAGRYAMPLSTALRSSTHAHRATSQRQSS
jgi:hypothetical protein